MSPAASWLLLLILLVAGGLAAVRWLFGSGGRIDAAIADALGGPWDSDDEPGGDSHDDQLYDQELDDADWSAWTREVR